MRPVPIPDDVAARVPGERIVVGPPGNDLDSPIEPVEAMKLDLRTTTGFAVRIALEDGDLARLADDGHVWITMFGEVVPFAVQVGP